MINNAESGQSFTYGLLVAIGQQRIEQGAPQLMHRIDSHIAYAFKNDMHIKLHYQYSNTAQATAIGRFSLSQIGLSLLYKMFEY